MAHIWFNIKNMAKSQEISAITTTLSTPTSQTTKDKDVENSPVPTIVVNINEQNNNSIDTLPTSKKDILQCLPEMFTDIDLANHKNLNDSYISGDLYKSYIFGKFLHCFSTVFRFSFFSLFTLVWDYIHWI